MSNTAGPAQAVQPRRRQHRSTSPWVTLTDRAMTGIITVGGISVIFAVMGIMVYLVTVVLPLFRGAELGQKQQYALLSPDQVPGIRSVSVDEYQVLGMYVLSSGEAVYFAAKSGVEVSRHRYAPPGAEVTAVSRPLGDRIAVGYGDGTVSTGRIGFDTEYLSTDHASVEALALAAGQFLVSSDGVIERIPTGELRRIIPLVSMDAPIPVAPAAAPVRLIDYRPGESQSWIAVFCENGELLLEGISRRENMLTGEVTGEVAAHRLPVPEDLLKSGPPSFLLVTTRGDQVYLAWKDGRTVRWDMRNPDEAVVAEIMDFAPEAEATLEELLFNSGEQSLLTGDSDGRIRAWFRLSRSEESQTADVFSMVPAHTLPKRSGGITALGISGRDKSLIAGTADGRFSLLHLTSERLLAEMPLAPPSAIRAALITQKGDGVFVVGADGRATLVEVSNPHPQTTLSSIFGKVWYEGYPDPEYTWQSSSATDDFEPKLSLIPLVFGTFKATLYSMLFAIPIALFAAIYTSEFLDRKYRAPLKSTIEMMASLPSVVLGFLAALVLAPVVESAVTAVLVAFGIVPVLALAFGYAWQILPPRVGLRLSGRSHFLMLIAVVILGSGSALYVGVWLEKVLFAGDFTGWLDGRFGSGAPGIALIAWPLIVTVLLVLDRRVLSDILQRRMGNAPRSLLAVFELAKFALLITASIAGAWGVAVVLAGLGLDPRPHLLGTYVQRNALVTGFVMGFAVVPIIYTIAEDALSAVPNTLRSASLGCGATRWQTAVRVIMPVALPGIFSALMVGLGRAVGETMIVLMAAGNTPILDLNVFNGLRTLSANIAVELPEAAKEGTLFRVLFLAALTLFGLTFIINTVAEIVRQRFRWRTHQL